MLKLTTDKNEASRGLSATAELLVVDNIHDNINLLDLALWAEKNLKLKVF